MLFNLDSTYNFDTISTTILKPSYKNLKVVSYLGFKQAVRYSGIYTDVVTARQQLVKETGNTLLDSREAKYILFEDEYENEILLAEDWIKPDTILLVTSTTLNLTIEGLTTSDVPIIVGTLKAMGYNKVTPKLL